MLWLVDDKISEVGTMNLFVHWTNTKGETELVTAPLNGTILPGVTRRSILDLAHQWKEFKVEEKEVTMTELATAIKEGRVKEIFGAGTAAIVSPVERILYKGTDYHIPVNSETALSTRFANTILSIQVCFLPLSFDSQPSTVKSNLNGLLKFNPMFVQEYSSNFGHKVTFLLAHHVICELLSSHLSTF